MIFHIALASILFLVNAFQPIYAEEVPVAEAKKLKKLPFKWVNGDNSLEFSSKIKLELFYGKNNTLLNDANCDLDKVFAPVKYTLDFATLYGFGCHTRGYDIVRMKSSIRSKGVWGSPETIATTDDSFIKDVDVVSGKHNHSINRNILWVREMWLELVLNDMVGFNACNKYIFTAGFFPFQLGRGIALGDAYATDPDFIGYYSPNVVDQYAPGLKLTGEFSPQVIGDFYVGIIHNKANSFGNVNMKVRGQELGHRLFPARGFGKINWLMAARVKWWAIKDECNTLLLEPYALYDNQAEQRIAFVGDASTKLGTFGLAMEARFGAFECGFDFAKNIGAQNVKGWDRNIVIKQVRTGVYYEVNSAVTAIANNPATNDLAGQPAVFTSANQQVIEFTPPQDASANGKQIGDSNLKNAIDRYNDPYRNKFNGLMVVGDMSYRFCEDLQMALGAGMATGDENPNRDLNRLGDSNHDSVYNGFIGLQEVYSGTRVRSAFLLSGPARIPRLLSFPTATLPEPYPDFVSRFTNIIFAGWAAVINANQWSINPNILNYWQEHRTRIFDTRPDHPSGVPSERFARSWLGLELNVFADIKLPNDVKFFAVGAAFIPGTHFSDVKGLPISKEQQRFLARRERISVPGEFVPTLGNNTAYMINIGMEYKF
jgi:hypothetical protein